jgi:hypothetical protein
MLSLLVLVVSLTNKLFPSPAELVIVYGISLLIWVELDLLFKTLLLKAVCLEDLGGWYEGLSFSFRLCSVRWEVLISSMVCS